MRVKVNEIKDRKTIFTINEIKRYFFERVYKIDELFRLIKKKKWYQ